jgi:hypothetical protein
VVSKGQFAALRNVSRGRVSQWISEGKIKPDALVGEGRNAKIKVAVATRQLRDALDVGQLAGNGVGTRPDLPPLAQASPAAPTREPAPPLHQCGYSITSWCARAASTARRVFWLALGDRPR